MGLVVLGLLGLVVASASIDGPGWFDPGEKCALDSSGGISSADSGAFAKQVRFFPPRVTCSVGGVTHAYQDEARSWLTGVVLLAALVCLVAGTVLLWRRAHRIAPATPGGHPRPHVVLAAVVGGFCTVGWGIVLFMSLFTSETGWGAVAAGATCLALGLPLFIGLDDLTGPPRRRLSTSWWRGLAVLAVTAAGASVAALLARAAQGGPALGPAGLAAVAGGAVGAAVGAGATWLVARHARPDQREGLWGS